MLDPALNMLKMGKTHAELVIASTDHTDNNLKNHRRDKMTDTVFTSATYEVEDALEANELYQRNGWTDGLPVVPPTERAVLSFLDVVCLQPSDLIGVEPVRRRQITAEKVAIAAVMAGC